VVAELQNDIVWIGNRRKRIMRTDIATQVHEDVGRQWLLRQTMCREDAKSVWMRQNGLCAYCDVVISPPDGAGVATCCRDYIEKTIFLSDPAKLQRMQQESNTEVGSMVFDRVLYKNKNVFVCMACAQVHSVNRLDNSLGFSHSESLLLTTPVGNNDDNLFFYMAACSGLHLVFSMYLCEMVLPILPVVVESTITHAVVPLPSLPTRNTTTPNAIEPEHITIMAYVTNLRDAELVYLKVPTAKVDVRFRAQLQTGLTLSHPNFANNTVQILNERAVDSNDAEATISSRYHIFHCICDSVNRRLQNFMQERDDDERNYAGRLFVYVCQQLRGTIRDVLSANSAEVVWRLVRDRLQHRYAHRSDISPDDIAFRATAARGQHVFRENTVLLARRDTRDQPSQNAHLIQNLCLQHGDQDHIMDSIVLLQHQCPTPMLTLVQNGKQHHLYRLVAVCEIDGTVVHWFDVENWNHLKTMPTCDTTDLCWFETGRGTSGPRNLHDVACSFAQVAQKLREFRLRANTPRSAAIEATRYVCFYQRLTRNQHSEDAVPIRMASPVARHQALVLRTLFGVRSRIIVAIRTAAVANNTRSSAQANTAFDELTQRCVRTMAVAIKLLGFMAVNELHAGFQLQKIAPRDCHLMVYLLWNKFVIHEGFDAKTERVHEYTVLGQNIDAFGDMDLDSTIERFQHFLTRQCDTSRAVGRPDDVQDAFVNARSLLSQFHLVIASRHVCTTTQHAIQSLKLFEARIAKVPPKEIYPLGNTKLMLHYFSCLFGFKVLELYLSCIRDTLV